MLGASRERSGGRSRRLGPTRSPGASRPTSAGQVHTPVMGQTVNIREAKTHLERLLDRVQAGEEVTIAKAGRPIAKLTAFQERPERRVPGNVGIMHPEDPMRDLLR